MFKHSTAILVFGRTASTEITFKPIIEGNAADNYKMYDYLYKETLRAADATDLPVIICDEQLQKGDLFAEKITNALLLGFNYGYENLILIGNNCPEMSSAILLDTYNRIADGEQFVLGPNRVGGLYLLAINKNVFNKEVFLQFNWQTNHLFNQLKEYADLFSGSILPHLVDINTKEDVILSFNKISMSSGWQLLLNQIITRNILLYTAFTKAKQSVKINIDGILIDTKISFVNI